MIKSHLMVDQFILELKLQAFLNHENILTLFHHFDDTNSIYLVLEYMEEGTLFSQLKKNKTIKEKEVAQKIKQIASSVKYLHQNEIAHRDIKPENIVLSHVLFCLCRVYVNYVILDGLLYVIIEGKLTVVLLTMLLQKYYKE